MATITAPVKGFSGVVVGVDFKDGTGETDDTAQIQYFTRQGYKVEGDLPATDGTGETPPPADNSHVDTGAEMFPPNGNASKDEWLAYAKQQGRTDEELEGLNRDAIRDLFN